MNGLIHSQLKSLELLNQGKVRDIYNINDDKMLIVTTDRISAFDVIMKQAIPLKGQVLTQMANFWFKKIDKIVPNHLTHEDPLNFVHKEDSNKVKNRAIVVRKLNPIPVEAIIRGYLIGSGWKDYQMNQSVCGINLPQGLKLAEQLLEPIFTPSNKAKVGDKDENISIKILPILRKIVSTKEGTANLADIHGYDIGGKTGTANKSLKGVYSNEKVNTFVSVFPTSNPKFVLLVLLDEPKASKEYVYHYRDGRQPYKGNHRNTAGWTTVEIAGKIIEKIGPILATKYIEAN